MKLLNKNIEKIDLDNLSYNTSANSLLKKIKIKLIVKIYQAIQMPLNY